MVDNSRSIKMLLSGHRAFTHNAPTTYERITPDRGCGFILKRIYDLTYNSDNDPPTKQEVYAGSKWAGREKNGFASLLWSSLLEDGLIRSDDGMVKYDGNCAAFFRRAKSYARAKGHFENGKYTVRYHITANGMTVLFDMMNRCCKDDPYKALNTVGSVAEYDAKKDDVPPTPTDREVLQKEALDCAKLAADTVAENQKLRAEKNDMKERLKKLYGRLIVLETTIHELQDEVAALAWDK